MNKNEAKPRKIILECDHVLWLRLPYPRQGDTLYCRTCSEYRTVGPVQYASRVFEPDYDWSWTTDGHKSHARCEVKGCAYETVKANWYQLRDHMESHHLQRHSGSSLIRERIVDIPKQTYEGEAPF